MPQTELVHATTVAIGGRGVLISGPSGSGKSDLALRLIDRGAKLVADDQTIVRAEGAWALAFAPQAIAGRLEVRGVGILAIEQVEGVALSLCVELSRSVERLPVPRTRTIAGVSVAELLLDPEPVSAPIKVELAVAHPSMVIA